VVSPEQYKSLTLLHNRRVHTLAAWMLGDWEEARDVTQEVFLRLWERRAAIIGAAVRVWLLRTTRHLCIDRLRVRAARRPSVSLDRIDGRASDIESAERRALRQDESRSLARALLTLSFRDRAAILLREGQGLSYAELALVLEMPLGTVKASLHRAREQLRAALIMEEVSA
jgi:RNA polymerase sigma-70 factor (ECF subfamily)